MLNAVISATFILICSAAPASLFQNASPDPDQQQDQNAADSPNPNDYLAVVAARNPESAQLFKSLPQGNVPESSFATLHEIFLAAQDTFHPDETKNRWVSLRGLAIERLKQAGPGTLQAWNRTALASSKTAWEAAVKNGDLAGAATIAAGWPLSELHLRLSLLQALEAWQAGEFGIAEATINQTHELYADTFLQPLAQTLLLPLQRKLQSPSPNAKPGDSHQPLPSPLPPFPTQQPVSTVSLQQSLAAAPWPRPIWTWRESVQSQNSELQQAESNLLLAQDPQTAAMLGNLQLWKPLCWGPWIICRTPARIVALDRRTGNECWLVQTDPALRDPNEKRHFHDSDFMDFNHRDPRPIDIKQDTRWGIVAVDHEYLWFVDRFPIFSGHSQQLDDNFPPGPLPRFNSMLPDELQPASGGPASRIVCLRRRRGHTPDAETPPEVAWIAGNRDFPYSVFPAKDLSRTHQPSQEPLNETPPDPFTDRLFCSGPAISANRLVILSESADHELLEVDCLNRTSGQLIWRSPLALANPFREIQGAFGGRCQSVCLISSDLVICSIEGAVLAAFNLCDGTCRWMQSLAPLESDSRFPEETLFTRSPFLPAASPDVVICSAPRSLSVQAVETVSGRILWSVPRRTNGADGPGGSPDILVAGLFKDQVILVGERHCRSLDLANGSQRWIVEISPCSGAPLCTADRCIVPQVSGKPIVINVRTGTRVEQSELFLPPQGRPIAGALASDQELIFSGTSGAVAAWPTASDNSPIEQIQTLLLNGNITAAAEIRDSLARDSASPNLQQAAADLLGEAWLLQYAADLAQSKLPEEVPANLTLNPIQLLRLSILRNTPLAVPPEGITQHTLLKLDGSWNVSLSALRPAIQPVPINPKTLAELPLPRLREFVAAVCQHPAAIGDVPTIEATLHELVKRGQLETAEILAAAWWLHATDAVAQNPLGDASVAEKHLRHLRSHSPNSTGSANWDQSNTGNAASSPANNGSKGLLASNVRELQAVTTLQLRNVDPSGSDPEGIDLSEVAPWWFPHQLRLSVASESGRNLLILDQGDGGVLERFPSGNGWTAPSVDFRQSDRLLSTPPLVPLTDENRLQMLALRPDGSVRQLWSRDLAADNSPLSQPEPGPLWPGGFIWHQDDTLYCLHPLTGQTLWTRALPQEAPVSPLMFARLFGDHQAIVVMGADGSSCERFRSSDGRLLGRSKLQVGRGTECGIVGRFLIYTDLNYQLHIFDGASGADILADEPAVLISRTHTERLFAALPGNRILTVTHTGELVLVDLTEGRQLFRTPLPPQETMASISGIQGIELQGQILVAIENAGAGAAFGAFANGPFQPQGQLGMFGPGISEEIRKRPRGSALVIDDGFLCALDHSSGKIHWIQPRYDCQLHQIGGDPTDLLILTESRYSQSPTPDGGLAELMNIEVLHPQTGAPLLKAGQISLSRIHAAAHHAELRQIQLFATDGQITLQERRR